MKPTIRQAATITLALFTLPACDKKDLPASTPNSTPAISSESLPRPSFEFTRNPNYQAWKKLQISPESPEFNSRVSKVKSAFQAIVPGEVLEPNLQTKFTPELAAAFIMTVSAHQHQAKSALNSIYESIDSGLLKPRCRSDDPNRNQIFFEHAFDLGKTFLNDPKYSQIILKHFGQEKLDCLEINSSMLIAQIMLVNPYLKLDEEITLAPTLGMIVDDKLFKNGGQHLSIGASFNSQIDKYYDGALVETTTHVNQISAEDPRWVTIAGYLLVLTKKEDRIKIGWSEPQLYCIPE